MNLQVEHHMVDRINQRVNKVVNWPKGDKELIVIVDYIKWMLQFETLIGCSNLKTRPIG